MRESHQYPAIGEGEFSAERAHHGAAPGPPPQTASQIVHDLNTALIGVRLLVQAVQDSEELSPFLRRHVASVEESAIHAMDLCSELQSVLRGDYNHKSDEQMLDLSGAVESMRPLLDAMFQHDQTLNVDMSEELPLVWANPTHVREVLIELVSNACEALQRAPGAVTIRTGLFEGATRWGLHPKPEEAAPTGDDWVLLEVSDTGCGMDERALRRLFQKPFTDKPGGHGLGLTSVRRIVRGHGGVVMVESREGEGTTVRCVFPAHAAQGGDPRARDATAV